MDRGEPRFDRFGAPDGAARGLEDGARGAARRASGDIYYKILRGGRAAGGARSRHPGAWSAGHDRRHAAGRLVPARARRPHLRRPRRSAQAGGRAPRAARIRAGAEMTLDAPRPVRPGEELDLEKLRAFLNAGEVRVEQFPKGHSNLTYLVNVDGSELVLRRPPRGSKVRTAHDMGREARILLKLHPVFPLAPRVVRVCDDPA